MKDTSIASVAVKARFKSKDVGGRYLLQSLFIDKCLMPNDREDCLYTLREEDHTSTDGTTYPSLYKFYMEMEDIHEVTFARTYFSGYKHWKTLCETDWFKPVIEGWREELELSLMSKGFLKLKAAMESDDKASVVVAKYFLDRSWDQGIHSNPKVQRGRGRPSKKALQEKMQTSPDVSEDYNRLIGKAN